MNLTDFDFELPEQLIAQHPSGIRGNDRLMEMNRITGEVIHHAMEELPDLISPDTLMVFNDSRVRRARCYGIKQTTGREQEFMFLNPVSGVWANRQTLLLSRLRSRACKKDLLRRRYLPYALKI